MPAARFGSGLGSHSLAFEEEFDRSLDGSHKGYQMGLQARENRILLVSEIKNCQPISKMITAVEDLDTALDYAKFCLPGNSRIALLPDATQILQRMNDL